MKGAYLQTVSDKEESIMYNGQKVGFIRYSDSLIHPNIKNAINIDSMYIDTEHRRQGIGKAAYAQFEQKVQTKGVGAFTLEDRSNRIDFSDRETTFWDGRGFECPDIFPNSDLKYKNLNSPYDFNQQLNNVLNR